MATKADSGLGSGRTALDETDVKGAFKRVNSVWRNHIEEGGEFSPASGRYHLYVALACPWADGTLAALFMKGLEDCIGYSIVHPTWQRSRPEDPADQHHGWIFCKPGDPPLSNGLGFGSFECDDALVPDTVNGAKFIRDIYEKAGDTGGKYSTPVLWDKEKNTIVNNESMDILSGLLTVAEWGETACHNNCRGFAQRSCTELDKLEGSAVFQCFFWGGSWAKSMHVSPCSGQWGMFNSKFNQWAKKPDLDLFPADLEAEADAANSWIYPNINNGVYRCGFAKSQEAYDQAVKDLGDALAKAEALLEKQRYVCKRFSYMDLRLFMTLVRFDAVYVVYFKTNVGTIEMNYPNLLEYCKDIYQFPGMAKAINMRHIKMHYFTSHPDLNKFAVIPRGRDVDYAGDHKRAKLSA